MSPQKKPVTLEQIFDKLIDQYHSINVALKRIETKLDRRQSHEMKEDWRNVNKRVTTLEKRVQVLESK